MADTPAQIGRVLIVSHYFPPHVGGIENVAHHQAKHLTAVGVRVRVVTSAVGAPAGTERHPDGFQVTRIPVLNVFERSLGVPFPVFSLALIWRTLRMVSWADVVHVHEALYMSSWVVAFWCRLLGKPLFLTQHVAVVAHPHPLVWQIQRLVYNSAGRFVINSARRIAVLNSGVLKFIRQMGVQTERMLVLPNGVDTTMFSPANESDKAPLREKLGLPVDRPLALFVGRFVPKKGFDKILAAASNNYTIVLVGGAPRPPHGDDPRLLFLGPLEPSRLSDVYRACDIFILPSETEGFPLTAQEAMASGLPVVLTDDPGYDVYGLDRDHVLMIEPTVDAVRDALHRLAGDESERLSMSRYSVDYAHKHFLWETHVQRLRDEYADVSAEIGV